MPNESYVRPVRRLPVATLRNRVVGVQIQLANGTRHWALLGNIDEQDDRLTQHFLKVSLFVDDVWFHLARYHDFDWQKHGSRALAKALGLKLSDVFPMLYDVSKWVVGKRAALKGVVEVKPMERLTRRELIALSIA